MTEFLLAFQDLQHLDSFLVDPESSQTQRIEGAPSAEDFTSCLIEVFKSADISRHVFAQDSQRSFAGIPPFIPEELQAVLKRMKNR